MIWRHYRWLRLMVQMACTVLEQLGTYPRDRPPIPFLMEFATLGLWRSWSARRRIFRASA
jgi:hypothetical protein